MHVTLILFAYYEIAIQQQLTLNAAQKYHITPQSSNNSPDVQTLGLGVFGLHKAEMLRVETCARDMRSVSFLGAELRLRLIRCADRAQKDTAR